MRLTSGQKFGSYTLQRRLGAGGMAEVWAALHEALGVEVAIKVLLSRDPRQQRRLRREGRAQAQLEHPNILPVHDIIDVGGAPGLVMPLVRGPSLQQLLRHHQPDVAAAAALLLAVLAGVRHAHQHGMVHRDLKPANVLLRTQHAELVPVVGDFGLVKDLDDLSGTRTGSVMGTLRYAAPEQLLDASAVDARADLFSLGVMLVELLRGAPPFAGPSLGELLRQHQAGPDLDGVPDAWVPLCASLLQRDPDRRPADCAAVAQAVSDLMPPLARSPLAAGGLLSEVIRSMPPPAEEPAPETFSGILADTESGDGLGTEGPSNLPAEADLFVARTRELRRLQQLLPVRALVSVLGPAGVGKTRLAVAAARQQLTTLPGGAWLCDLSEARDLEGFLAAVRATLGMRDEEGGAEAVGRAIFARGRCLLLLDNFEQLVDTAAETLGRWLEQAPQATFLVTSRALLGLSEEERFRLGPLEPEDASALFAARARQQLSRFVLDDTNRDDVDALVKRLDGLPLAVELAAARIRLMRPAAMLSRMSQRFQLLKGRGATLRAAIDWSWEHLSTSEQAAFAQCAVFESGFTLSAAESVVELPEPEAWVGDVIQALVEKSLLRPLGDNPLGEPRLGMLQSLQEYAAERLEEHAARACRRRHMSYFAAFGAPEQLWEPPEESTPSRQRALSLEAANLIGAVRHAVACSEARPALEAATALAHTVRYAGRGSTVVELFRQAWALAARAGAPAAARAEAGLQLGRLLNFMGLWSEVDSIAQESAAHFASSCELEKQAAAVSCEGDALFHRSCYAEAEECFRRALSLAQGAAAPYREALVNTKLGNTMRYIGRVDEAETFYIRALELYQEIGAPRALSDVSLEGLGAIARHRGQLEEAGEFLRQSLAIHQQSGDIESESRVTSYIASLYTEQGRLKEAAQLLSVARALNHRIGKRVNEGELFGKQAQLHFMMGQLSEAEAMCRRSLSIMRELGHRSFANAMLCNLAVIYTHQQRLDKAEEVFREVLDTARELGRHGEVALMLNNLAKLLLAQGRYDEGLRFFDEALPACSETSNGRLVAGLEISRADAELDRGDLDTARSWLASARASLEALDVPPEEARYLCARARLALEDGRLGDAEADVRAAEALGEQLQVSPSSDVATGLARLRAQLRTARAEQAEPCSDERGGRIR